MSRPRIHCLLHPKEKFAADGAGAFALNVLQSSRVSRLRDAITVFGVPVEQPFEGVAFQPVVPVWPRLLGNRAGFMRGYARLVQDDPPDLIECFNRPGIALWLAKRFPKIPVTVYFGNDPQTMEASRSPAERSALASRLGRIYCVSDFIRRQFIEGLSPAAADKAVVLYTGMPRAAATFPVKEPGIVFVGRMVPNKGVLELAEALARVLPNHPSWRAHLIGARWFGSGEAPTEYETAVQRAAAACPRIEMLGFRPNDEVVAYLRRAAIAAVPSNWDDPFPRTAVEALSEGCALICSRRGGLPELGARARFLPEVTTDAVAAALEDLISNDGERQRLQKIAWDDYPFSLRQTAGEWDDHRTALLDDHVIG
jgi:glycosyltransferase involved in cell wall biosynthesis